MKKIVLIILMLLITTSAYSEVEFNLNVAGFNQEQINMIPAVIYRMAYEAGDNQVPQVRRVNPDAVRITFDSLTPEALAVMTRPNLISTYQTIVAENAVAEQEAKDRFNNMKNSIRLKLTTGGVWTDEEVTFFYGVINRALNN